MAKKATTRVFQLAKELGVSSKDIVSKCQAEEIPGITNHMSAVSLGLAATISEWFSDGGSVVTTAVETSAPVDIAKARAKATKKAARKASPKKAAKKATTTVEADAADEGAAEATPTAPVASAPAAPPETPPAEPAAAPPTSATPPTTSQTPPADVTVRTEPVEEPAAPIIETVERPSAAPSIAASAGTESTSGTETTPAPGSDVPGSDAPGSGTLGSGTSGEDAGPGTPPAAGDRPEATPVPTAGEGEDGSKPVMNVPTRPKVIAPAGPRLQQPVKTKLAGPKVIRVEKPDPVPQARRAPRSDGPMRGGGPRTGRGVGTVAPMDAPGGPGGGPIRGGGGPGAGGRGGTTSRRNKRRSASARPEGRSAPRTGQGGDNRNANWREQDLLERERRLNRASGFIRAARRDNQKRTTTGGQRAQTAAQAGGVVKIAEPITLKSLSEATGVKVNDLIRQLVKSGEMITSQDVAISSERALELMLEYDIELDIVKQVTAEEKIVEAFKSREMEDERGRAPVVTILGHVDHGKTSLLDRIRQTNVAEGEAGGITQATSAFRVPVHVGDDEHEICFIDTPGHEAFTEMRSRGAQMTDIVILVVAGDDGVMPQTIESINHAKAAEVPIIVALNKIDKPESTDSNIQRILGQLAEHGLNPAEWGGNTEVLRISALQGDGIQELLEMIDYQAQLLELAADFGGQAEGSVIEAQLEEGRGAVARILVQQGKLKKGDFIVVGRAYGRVRDIVNDRSKRVDEAMPSTPVAISGINEVPDAGDRFYVVKNIRAAEAAAAERREAERNQSLATEKVTLDNIFDKLAESARKELPLIVKADVQGSLETLRATLGKIGSDEVKVVIKHSAVGGVNESDISLAEAAGAIIVGFNVTTSAKARRSAESKGIDVRLYDVIYDLTDDVTKAAEGLLEPELKLEVLGHAEVKEVFKIAKVGMIAGCYVTDGVIERHAQIRVTRDGIVVESDRRLEQLKRFKDDAKAVNAGQECGMLIDGYDDIKVGDVLECYKTLEVRRSLSD